MFDWDTLGGYGPEQTAGHSGSKTSEAAALRPKGKRMKSVYEHLEDLGHVGATCEEIENFFEIGHGAASGALTRLHRGEYVERLAETRGGQEVYVLPSEVRGREVSPYRPNAAYREDRKPMPLERPEPTLESITQDLVTATTEGGTTIAYTKEYAELLAGPLLEIVRKYR